MQFRCILKHFLQTMRWSALSLTVLFNRPVVVGLFSLTWRARPQNKLVRRLYNIVRRDISSRMLFAGYFQSVLSSDSEQAIL